MSLKSWLRSYLIGDLEVQLQDLEKTLDQLSDKVENLNRKVDSQEEQLKQILKDLNRKADIGLYYELSERLETARDEIKAIETELSSLWDKVKFIEFSFSEKTEQPEMTIEELASVVEHYIRKGLTRPSELKKAVGVSWEKLYAILSYLKIKKRVKRIQKGRKVEYILVEESGK
uniref:Transcriptional regulator n=1 Tax=Thermococcus sp. CIR10 TaxID=1197731 RepID=L0B8I0_9EURY|nr:transcriptional regulator [Thermococcus sp. CIR10]AFZ84260.1 transcriptional regulator [Thermococcus sp. CIR10]